MLLYIFSDFAYLKQPHKSFSTLAWKSRCSLC